MNEPLHQLIAGMRQGGPDFAGDPLKAGADFAALLATMSVAEDLVFSEVELGGLPALHSPTEPADAGALLYFHGGAFACGSASGYRGLATGLGRAAGVQTFSADYRLAPEDPFPAAVDAVAAYRGLLAQGIEPGELSSLAIRRAGGSLSRRFSSCATSGRRFRRRPSCSRRGPISRAPARRWKARPRRIPL